MTAFMIAALILLLIGCLWAAPAATVRGTPAGIKLKDGYKATYTFERFPTVSFFEIEVEPPGYDGGEAIDTTTMHNTDWVTKFPQSLMEMTEVTGKAAYDPNVHTQIDDMININDEITATHSDGTTIAFWGYLRTVKFDPLVKGQFPTCSFTIQPTNTDNAGAEQAPVVVSVSGT